MRKSKVYDEMAQLDSHDIFYTAVERLLDIPLTSRDRISATHRNPYSKEIKIKPNANAKRIRQFVIRNEARIARKIAFETYWSSNRCVSSPAKPCIS